MRVLKKMTLIVVAVLTLAADIRPGAAMVIYPWCANYGGPGKGGYGASSCGSTSFKQCWRRSQAMGEPAVQIRGINHTLRQRPMLRPYGADQFSIATPKSG